MTDPKQMLRIVLLALLPKDGTPADHVTFHVQSMLCTSCLSGSRRI